MAPAGCNSGVAGLHLGATLDPCPPPLHPMRPHPHGHMPPRPCLRWRVLTPASRSPNAVAHPPHSIQFIPPTRAWPHQQVPLIKNGAPAGCIITTPYMRIRAVQRAPYKPEYVSAVRRGRQMAPAQLPGPASSAAMSMFRTSPHLPPPNPTLPDAAGRPAVRRMVSQRLVVRQISDWPCCAHLRS